MKSSFPSLRIILVVSLLSASSVISLAQDNPVINKDSVAPININDVLKTIELPKELKVSFPPAKPDLEAPQHKPSALAGVNLSHSNSAVRTRVNPNFSVGAFTNNTYNIINQPIAVRELSKTLAINYKLADHLTFNASGTIGYTSLPLTIVADQAYDVRAGLTYSPSSQMSLNGGVSIGKFVHSSYIDGSLSMRYDINDHWRANAFAGVYSTTLPYQNSYNALSAYAGMKLTYTTDNGMFIYGQGFTSMNNGHPAPLFNRNPMAYGSGFGGGIGYNIYGGGPVSIGVNWVYNPFTNTMKPVAQIDIMGGISWLIKKIIAALEGEGSFSHSDFKGYKKPLPVSTPTTYGPFR